jgi:hypothetical protein
MGNDKSFGSAFREIFARKKSEANRVEPAESVDFVAELISPHAPIEVAPDPAILGGNCDQRRTCSYSEFELA